MAKNYLSCAHGADPSEHDNANAVRGRPILRMPSREHFVQMQGSRQDLVNILPTHVDVGLSMRDHDKVHFQVWHLRSSSRLSFLSPRAGDSSDVHSGCTVLAEEEARRSPCGMMMLMMLMMMQNTPYRRRGFHPSHVVSLHASLRDCPHECVDASDQILYTAVRRSSALHYT